MIIASPTVQAVTKYETRNEHMVVMCKQGQALDSFEGL